MKKLLILGAFLGLFGTSSIFASEVENVNASMEQVNVAVDYVDGVNYWVTDMHMDYGAGGPDSAKRCVGDPRALRRGGNGPRPWLCRRAQSQNA